VRHLIAGRALGAAAGPLLAVAIAATWPEPRRLPMKLATIETAASKPLPGTMPGGLAVLDFDGDGLLDLFFPNNGGASHKLFRNLGGLRFEDVTGKAGLAAGREHSFGAAVGDYDGDGDPDLLVTGIRSLALLRNRGDGTFEAAKAPDNRGRWAVAAAWLDKDRDGDLDLFVVNYVGWDAASERECIVAGKVDFCHPKFYPPSANALFENTGGGAFLDVSAAAGIDAHPGKGMSVAVADFDGNGFPDLFVTNDRVFNSLFLNTGGTRFREAAFEWGVAAPQDGNPVSAMGVDAQDVDNDGRIDLIYTALRDETFPLYRNTGSAFEEITGPSRLGVLTRPMAGWGVVLADLDNDGWKDVVVARSDALSATGGRGPAAKEPPAWLRNTGAARFAAGGGWEHLPAEMYRGAAAADFDGDGCLDVVFTALGSSPMVLRNPCATGGAKWLKVDVRQPGVRVRVGERQWRVSGTAVGYASSVAAPLHFGLGASGSAPAVDVEVFRPDGRTKLLRGVAVNRTLKVELP
jgi:hypothetical protein